jgi:hypothetical protein
MTLTEFNVAHGRLWDQERRQNSGDLIELPLPKPCMLLDLEESRIYNNWSKPVSTRVPSKWRIIIDGELLRWNEFRKEWT